VDIEGNVLGLNAGGNQVAASSFFLPLERVRRALELIQQGKPVTRGGLLTSFQYTPYDELRRLGLREETEQQLRAMGKGIGMLVISAVLPQGPADGLLQPGDILLKVDGRWINHFAELEALLDVRVGEEVELRVERGGRPLTLRLPVADLHGVTPDRYLGFGNGILHDLSYQQARQLNKPLTGVYVAASGYTLASAGVPPGAVLTAIEDEAVVDLAGLISSVGKLADGQKAVLRFYSFSEPNREQVAVMTMDRRWFPVKVCHRDDGKGFWPCEVLPASDARQPTEGGVVHFESYGDPRAERLSTSLAHISFNIPYQLDGVAGSHYLGVGLVVDAEHGLLVTDRNTVPVAMGDVTLTFGGALEIPGRVVFVHPTHNLVFVQYDPGLLQGSPVQSAQLNTEPLQPSDPVWLVGLNGNQRLQAHATKVAAIDPLQIPLSRVPMFRETNLEVIRLNNPPPIMGGVLADAEGRVRALWSSFSFGRRKNFTQFNAGMAIDLVDDLVKQWRCCQRLGVHSLEVELVLLPLSKARTMGLPDSWAERIQHNGLRRQVLMVGRLVAGSPAAALLREGDLLVAIDGNRVHDFREVERLSEKSEVEVTVIRKGQELSFMVETMAYRGRGTDHVVLWAGALLQKPYRSVAAQLGVEPQGAFVSAVSSGSPASRYRLPGLSRIIAVDDQPIESLDEFVRQVSARGNSDSLRLKVINLLGRESVVTLKPDNRYWPMREIRWQDGQWQRVEHALQHGDVLH
jgi:S1-C subfamily serine protease